MAVNDIVMGAAGASGPATFVEDIFSTFLYTGTGATQTITNGIDLSGKGGLIWLKSRSNTGSNILFDTVRGADNLLRTNRVDEQNNAVGYMTTFNSNGFGLTGSIPSNASGQTFASWSFREQPKFFDIVTYTGTGVAGKTVAHNLGSVPGCIIVKRTDFTGAWYVYHTSQGATKYSTLDTTNQFNPLINIWNNTSPTSSVFSVGNDTDVNANGGTYVAYLFAHNAGGFGATGTDNVISCGTYTGNGSATGPTVSLGYEPQYLMIKNATGTGNWQIIDNMRGMPVGIADATLQANLVNAETSVDYVSPNATGFQITSTSTEVNTSAATYIYMAIRRPMKTPTTGTEVFSPVFGVASSSPAPYMTSLTSFTVDAQLILNKISISNKGETSRLQGNGQALYTNITNAEGSGEYPAWDRQTGVGSTISGANFSFYITYNFKRAAGFFDVVCYTGTGVTFSPQHNLAAIPDLVICKRRNGADSWFVYANGFGGNNSRLNSTDSFGSVLNRITAATSTTFTVAGPSEVNQSGNTYVAYLFATVAGVSKVGSYTGNGSSQTINCSFTTGARFIMIKRTDSTGDWYVWDTARGIIAGNDPHLSLNTTAAEVTTDDSVDADSSGFIVNQLAATNINVNAAAYIYLAIA